MVLQLKQTHVINQTQANEENIHIDLNTFATFRRHAKKIFKNHGENSQHNQVQKNTTCSVFSALFCNVLFCMYLHIF